MVLLTGIYQYIFTFAFLVIVATAQEDEFSDDGLDTFDTFDNIFKRKRTLMNLVKKLGRCPCKDATTTVAPTSPPVTKPPAIYTKHNWSWKNPSWKSNSWRSKLRKNSNRGWGHTRRYPWKYLPDTICFRQMCKSDKECCQRWSICDKSARRCRDCWYGQSCKSERDCCSRYPYCERKWGVDNNTNRKKVLTGRCRGKSK